MAIAKFSEIVKFSEAHPFNGYGYDVVFDQVVSYKRDPKGAPIGNSHQPRHKYKLNGIQYSNSYIRREAMAIQAATGPSITPVEGAPNYAYILFSAKHECSQYFVRGTTLAHSVQMLQKRFPDLTGADVQIINPVTGTIVKPKVHTVTTYSF